MIRLATSVFLALAFLCTPLLAQKSGLSGGYILIAPMGASEAHLVSADKKIVHTWDCGEGPGNATYFEKGGTLLRTAKVTDNDLFQSRGGGGGVIRRFSWEGELLWDYRVSDEKLHHHHDVEPMPNGNVLVIAWERHSRDEAIAAGRDPETLHADALWAETILELKPVGKNDAEVVWKWRLWDHLIQDFDETKSNFGKVVDHPELADINYGIRRGGSDWIHLNSIDYHPELDQIVLGPRWFNEGWIIDHSTTTEEAASHSGGTSGKGGDLLYRWGNPPAYRRGSAEDRHFFLQHDVRWIDPGCPGAGHLLLFNNGDREAGRNFSSVDEFAPPIQKDGSYAIEQGQPYGPDAFTWSYSAPDDDFLSNRISGAQRLPNGNTLVCSGEQGWVFEVTPAGERIWEIEVAKFLSVRRGSCFRAPWYAKNYSSKLADLEKKE